MTAFYDATARGDVAAAAALLGPPGTGQDLAAWVRSVAGLDRVTVGEPRVVAADVVQQHPGQAMLLVVPVSYVATFRAASANDANGPADRFVLLGRAADGPWSILDISTSP